MGIPAYFSYIVKNHPEIIQKLVKDDSPSSFQVENFFLDSNSIIYDSVRNIDFDNLTHSISLSIIYRVISKIEEYISILSPSHTIFIAFDGVAPVAKLDQQRDRRYKSWYQSEITKKIYKKQTPDPFNTTAITPGTSFMNKLNRTIHAHFVDPSKYNAKKIVVSTSDIPGEGEHKIFEYIRAGKVSPDSQNVVYGLDADLIMLALNHIPVQPNIYLFRETPEFIKSIDRSLEPNETYLMNIPAFAKIITDIMSNKGKIQQSENSSIVNRTYDYIFLCFFLGNDFMPHFPSINIRTGGVDKMINAYKATIGGTNEILTDGKTIFWKNVRKVIQFLADLEEEHFQAEMKLRDKREKKYLPDETPEQKYMKFDALPTYDRDIERYINPYKSGWETRYYLALFYADDSFDEDEKKKICVNYLSGLEWNMKYYTSGCPDWRWSYQYNYPPLLADLIKYTPYFETTFIKPNKNQSVSPLVQLCYVLPRSSLQLLPEKLYDKLLEKHDDWYKNDCEFLWAFCKYFWESHVQLPPIDIGILESFIEENKFLLSL